MDPTELGRQLREVRELKELSLKRVAEPAEISAAYLQKLERGAVKDPSPHILYRLSEVLEVPYADLMRLANYVVPRVSREEAPPESEGVNLLAHALNSKAFEGLSAKELEELARYLRWYRHDRESRAG